MRSGLKRFVVQRILAASLASVVVALGISQASVPLVVVAGIVVVIQGALAVWAVRVSRPSPWTAEPAAQLAEIAHAVIDRVGNGWAYELAARDGYGARGIPVAEFRRNGTAGPVLWFESASTFRISLVLPDGDEISAERWRHRPADHTRLIDLVAGLCTGSVTTMRGHAVVPTATGDVTVDVLPAAALKRAREGFPDDD